MADYIRVDDKDDLLWLEKVLSKWLAMDPNNPILQVNYKNIYNWYNYLQNKVSAKEVKENSEEPVKLLTEADTKKTSPKPIQPKPRGRPPKKKNGKTVKKKVLTDPETAYECFAHKTYFGKRRPQTDCEKCWSVFKLLNPTRYKQAWADFQRQQRKAESS